MVSQGDLSAVEPWFFTGTLEAGGGRHCVVSPREKILEKVNAHCYKISDEGEMLPLQSIPCASLPVKRHGKLESYMQARPVEEREHGAILRVGRGPVEKVERIMLEHTEFKTKQKPYQIFFPFIPVVCSLKQTKLVQDWNHK